MRISVFGAAGPTGIRICHEALGAGHEVIAVSRRDDPLPLPSNKNLRQFRADVLTGEGMKSAVQGVDAVLSALGASFSRRPINVYSEGTRNIVEMMRAQSRGRRLVVVSAGLAYRPPPMNPIADHVLFPLLRGVLGRTLYADMRAMEEYLQQTDDIAWTVMRPGRLVDAERVSDYRLDPDFPTQGYTTRADLAAAMVAELDGDSSARRVLAPTSDREVRRR